MSPIVWTGKEPSLLGYSDWRNFLQVIHRAKISCEVSGQRILDHFVTANKMVSLGSGSQRKIPDILLTRYACYLIAQTYFAVQTRKFEIIQKHLLESERISARKKWPSCPTSTKNRIEE